jgi:glycosyltransferase involved in cell wall biosynthesis
MKILQIAAFDEPVPPKKYGGTELVVFNICEGLVAAGHDVHLIASGDSQTSAHLIPIVEKSLRSVFTEKEIPLQRDYYRIYSLVKILEIAKEIKPDVIHNHLSWRIMHFTNYFDCPIFSTMHGPLDIRVLQTARDVPNSSLVSISNNQRAPGPDLNWAGTVYNGIDVEAFELGTGDRDYFAFLGRIAPEKGLGEICRMIKKTSHKLKIAAKIDSADLKYYEEEVKPYIDGEQIEYIGEVDHAGKNEFLKGAKGLLLWLTWEEPFGLVVVEANACGTPVLVNPRGSMPELISEGTNGFLVDSLDMMQSRLDDVDTIEPTKCREQVQLHFSKEKMVSDYINIANRLISEFRK